MRFPQFCLAQRSCVKNQSPIRFKSMDDDPTCGPDPLAHARLGCRRFSSLVPDENGSAVSAAEGGPCFRTRIERDSRWPLTVVWLNRTWRTVGRTTRDPTTTPGGRLAVSQSAAEGGFGNFVEARLFLREIRFPAAAVPQFEVVLHAN